MRLPLSTRTRITREFLCSKDEKPSIRSVARKLNLPWRTVKRWSDRLERTASLHDLHRSGRKKLVNDMASQVAYQLMLGKPGMNASAAAKRVHSMGLTPNVVHKSTLIREVKRYANNLGTSVYMARGRPRKALSQDTVHRRLQFAEANIDRDWDKVMFTDRKRFLWLHPGVQVKRCEWKERGQQREAPTVNHPMAVNAYVGITRFGVTKCHLVAGTSKQHTTYSNLHGEPARNITCGEYKDVLMRTLLPEGARLFAKHGVTCWVFQQDNDPSHKHAGSVIAEWSKGQSCTASLLEHWPPNSPDLNPVENLWAHVQAQVDAMPVNNFAQFRSTVLATMADVKKEYLVSLFDSMTRRMQQVIDLGGQRLKY